MSLEMLQTLCREVSRKNVVKSTASHIADIIPDERRRNGMILSTNEKYV